MTGRLVTLGEALAVLSAGAESLRHASTVSVDIAGAEATVAIGVRRLGQTATWLGRVGEDAFGQRVLDVLRAERVEPAVALDPAAPTGLLLKDRAPGGRTRVRYHRAGSAGSRLAPADLDRVTLVAGDILHVTGITGALSATARAAVTAAVERATAAGALVSFDVNHRTALWPDDAAAREYLSGLASAAGIVFASSGELSFIEGADPPELVVTDGAAGASVRTRESALSAPAVPVAVTDTVGAGDSFAAGYLSGVLDGLDLGGRLERALRTAAFTVTSRSDWKGLPHEGELHLSGGDAGEVLR